MVKKELYLSSYEITSPIRLGLPLISSFNVTELLKAPSPHRVTLGVRALMYEFWGEKTPCHNIIPMLPKFISFSYTKYIHSTQTGLKVLIHSSINSKVLSPKLHLNNT